MHFLCTAQDVYLEFLERTNSSITMRRCDDCSSDAIDLSTNPVPFGDYFHYVAHVSSTPLHRCPNYISVHLSGQ